MFTVVCFVIDYSVSFLHRIVSYFFYRGLLYPTVWYGFCFIVKAVRLSIIAYIHSSRLHTYTFILFECNSLLHTFPLIKNLLLLFLLMVNAFPPLKRLMKFMTYFIWTDTSDLVVKYYLSSMKMSNQCYSLCLVKLNP